MADKVIYADLNLPSEQHTSALLHPSQQHTAQRNSNWYKIICLAGCIGNIILVATVIALVNSTCILCPGHWNLHRDKCYWKSQHVKTWNQSRDDCLRKNAELLVIQDKEEMEFIKQSIQDKVTYWIGLAFSVKKWMWVTGTQLDQNLFEEPIYAPNNKCGAVKYKILSEDCNTAFKWMCKKKSITLSF